MAPPLWNASQLPPWHNAMPLAGPSTLTCMDGPLARALFGFGIWSVAAMYTASKMQRYVAARPDEVSRRAGPDQWRALEGASVRTGCPVPLFYRLYAITSRCASPSLDLPVRYRRAGLVCLKLGQLGSCCRLQSVPRSFGPCGWPARQQQLSRACGRASGRASLAPGLMRPLGALAAR